MKLFNQARVYGAKIAAGATALAFAGMARADAMGDMLDAVDLTGLSVKIVAAGLLIVGIALAFKGPDLAKRVVRKV